MICPCVFFIYELRILNYELLMTIQFECPNCNALIAFDSKHIGKRARCQTCGQLFIIPSKDYEKPQKIKLEPERLDPLPGFFRAVFLDTWKLFVDKKNATQLVFVAAVVCFKFLAPALFCLAPFIHTLAWGWLLGFYLNIIYETAFGLDNLPEIYIGTSINFIWYALKPFLIFFFTMFIVQLPYIIGLILLQNTGINPVNMWQSHSGYCLLLQILFFLGLFFFPAAILTTAVGQDTALLRPDRLITLIFKAFFPYIVASALLICTGLIETQTIQYGYTDQISPGLTAANLAHNLAVQFIAIFAMRSIGLLYRHYSCYLKW